MEYFVSSLFYLFLIIWILVKALELFSFARSRKLPPGPKPLPIIGNLLELIGDKSHKSLAKLSNSYGPIMHLKLGQITTIVVSSAAVAREVLQRHDRLFSNRTVPDAIHASDHSEFSLPWMPISPTWRKLRKICNSHLFSAKVLDANMSLRHKKVQELLADVHKSAKDGEAVDIGKAAFKTSLNILSTTFFSMEYFADHASDTVRNFKEIVWGMVEEIARPNVADYFPILRMVDPQGIRKRTTIHFRKTLDLFGNIINRRLQIREKIGSTQDIDMLDTLINMTINKEKLEDHDQLDKTTIEHLLLDLFGAGTETTSATLEWSMAELLKAPEILSEAQAELEQVIGKGNQVKESDIARLPYLQAIVKETLRLHPTVPLLLPRKAAKDVKVFGYTIPKGAQVIVNVWAISRDSTIWENPEKFMPGRFLDSNIDVRGHDFEFTPFGAGRRLCPGLPLAIRILPLMLGSLLHSFDWMLEDGVTPETINMEDKFGLTLQMAQPLRAIPRSINT
ncbi:7-ethoxycoumarin O-deethylase [Morus notabilis]|uniref:7-ethoxycoumarin O-deethylase n=2 Tax=Morus notabilis TaxID=981085 RepID=W9S0E3_9ROSA|nr:7-ethoxycoumarin O-deethylase [Morus notabilis]